MIHRARLLCVHVVTMLSRDVCHDTPDAPCASMVSAYPRRPMGVMAGDRIRDRPLICCDQLTGSMSERRRACRGENQVS